MYARYIYNAGLVHWENNRVISTWCFNCLLIKNFNSMSFAWLNPDRCSNLFVQPHGNLFFARVRDFAWRHLITRKLQDVRWVLLVGQLKCRVAESALQWPNNEANGMTVVKSASRVRATSADIQYYLALLKRFGFVFRVRATLILRWRRKSD
jgi:hypothetical protein